MTVTAHLSPGSGRWSHVGSVALAVRTLRDLGMPWAEIERIMATSDPRVIRRHLDLHLERLQERLAVARTTLDGLEPVLARRLDQPAGEGGPA